MERERGRCVLIPKRGQLFKSFSGSIFFNLKIKIVSFLQKPQLFKAFWARVFGLGIHRMSNQAGKSPPLKGYRRRKRGLSLDLNNTPPAENPEQGGPSTRATSQPVVSTAMIDVEAIDDDVVFCSASAFAEARNKSQRNRGRNLVVDVESEEQTSFPLDNHKQRRVPVTIPFINIEQYINLESSNSVSEAIPEALPPPPSPPKEPTFNCPICMGTLVEETSTRCGHIFCKTCIREAIAAQAKCPTCRKRVTRRDLIRVFLPATSIP